MADVRVLTCAARADNELAVLLADLQKEKLQRAGSDPIVVCQNMIIVGVKATCTCTRLSSLACACPVNNCIIQYQHQEHEQV